MRSCKLFYSLCLYIIFLCSYAVLMNTLPHLVMPKLNYYVIGKRICVITFKVNSLFSKHCFSPLIHSITPYTCLRLLVNFLQAPYTLHCDSISWYETRFPTPTSDIVVTSTNSRTVYTEGNTRVVFWVRAVNSAGNVSQPITLPLTSGDVSKCNTQFYWLSIL